MVDAPRIAGSRDVEGAMHTGLKAIGGGDGDVRAIDLIDADRAMVAVLLIELPCSARGERCC